MVAKNIAAKTATAHTRAPLAIVWAAVCLSLCLPAFAKVSFDGLDLNDEDYLLFAVRHEVPGSPVYRTLFFTQVGEQKLKREPVILTCFPERMELVNGGKYLQLSNRYGTARYSISAGTLRWTILQPGIPSDFFRPSLISQSPNGSYYCYVKRTGATSGSLMIVDCGTGQESVMVDSVPFSYVETGVKWAPSGKVLLYEKNGAVYFASPEEALKKVNIPESYRLIGAGSISCVQWTLKGSLVYIRGDIVYRIDENELYTRGVYAPIVGSGRIIGRLPAFFDAFQDRFWTNADATQFVVITRDNVATLYSVHEGEDLDFMTCNKVFPLKQMDPSAYSCQVFWSTKGTGLLWVETLDETSAKRKSLVYRTGKSLEEPLELLFEAHESMPPLVSPKGARIAYTDAGVVRVRDMATGQEVFSDTRERAVSAVWRNENSLFVGGEESVRQVDFTGEQKVLFLSQAGGALWDGGRVISRLSDGQAYFYVSEKNVWKECKAETAKTTLTEKNARYRVFTGAAQNHTFENAAYVRTLSGKVKTYAVVPKTQEDVKLKKVAIVFDAMENAEGLESILATLDRFGVKATFFLNGEFIRRYPKKSAQIYASGNECASLFFSPIDLIDNNFVVDSAFIKRGLARNEDEFFWATGKELSLLWHAPYYRSTQAMRDAGAEAGYRYVDAFPLFSDAITFDQRQNQGIGHDSKTTKQYMSAAELVDAFTGHLYNGIVIPVSVGKPAGNRSDYLYEKLDLLISAIADSGCQIVMARDIK